MVVRLAAKLMWDCGKENLIKLALKRVLAGWMAPMRVHQCPWDSCLVGKMAQ